MPDDDDAQLRFKVLISITGWGVAHITAAGADEAREKFYAGQWVFAKKNPEYEIADIEEVR